MDALNRSENSEIEKAMLEDKLRATDWEATNEALEKQVAQDSYLQWVKENEMRNRKKSVSSWLECKLTCCAFFPYRRNRFIPYFILYQNH